jgi:copper chaperone CopZ
MCQVEHITNMDCDGCYNKVRERIDFILHKPLFFLSIQFKKFKRNNKTFVKKQNTISSEKKISDATEKSGSFSFKEGDIVRIRSKEEILKTLDVNNRLKGCLFMDEMWQYCGTEHKILKKVNNFYDEANFRMCKTRNTVLLEGIYCSGQFQRYNQKCDRTCLLFWKEDWLEAK